MAHSEPALYGGWQSERSGFMGNLSGLGFVLVAAAAITALIPIYARSWGPRSSLSPWPSSCSSSRTGAYSVSRQTSGSSSQ